MGREELPLAQDKDGKISYLFIVERMGSDYWSCHYRRGPDPRSPAITTAAGPAATAAAPAKAWPEFRPGGIVEERRVMQIAEALRLVGREVTMVIVDECPTYQVLRRLVSRGVEVECLSEARYISPACECARVADTSGRTCLHGSPS